MRALRFPFAAAAAVMVLLPVLVSAEQFNYTADNHSWSLSCNGSGYVLQSQYPVTRFNEAGAGSTISHETETLYLGRSCDASHTVLGDGKWCWANGGFVAEFPRNKIGFPRQELNCAQEDTTTLSCRC